jgi:hypothetical protein
MQKSCIFCPENCLVPKDWNAEKELEDVLTCPVCTKKHPYDDWDSRYCHVECVSCETLYKQYFCNEYQVPPNWTPLPMWSRCGICDVCRPSHPSLNSKSLLARKIERKLISFAEGDRQQIARIKAMIKNIFK